MVVSKDGWQVLSVDYACWPADFPPYKSTNIFCSWKRSQYGCCQLVLNFRPASVWQCTYVQVWLFPSVVMCSAVRGICLIAFIHFWSLRHHTTMRQLHIRPLPGFEKCVTGMTTRPRCPQLSMSTSAAGYSPCPKSKELSSNVCNKTSSELKIAQRWSYWVRCRISKNKWDEAVSSSFCVVAEAAGWVLLGRRNEQSLVSCTSPVSLGGFHTLQKREPE